MNADKNVERNIQDHDVEDERFHLRLKGLIKDESMRSFGRRVGISDTTIRKYLSGETEPTLSRLVSLAENCDVNLEWLATGKEAKQTSVQGMLQKDAPCDCSSIEIEEFNESFILIPSYQVSVSAGYGSLNDDKPTKRQLAFPNEWLRRRNLTACDLAVVFAIGESMEPTINNGNTVLVDLSDTKLKDSSIYVLRFGENLFAKRLQQRFDGSVCLKSDNKEYDDQIVKPDELEQLAIIGKVVWIGKDLY